MLDPRADLAAAKSRKRATSAGQNDLGWFVVVLLGTCAKSSSGAEKVRTLAPKNARHWPPISSYVPVCSNHFFPVSARAPCGRPGGESRGAVFAITSIPFCACAISSQPLGACVECSAAARWGSGHAAAGGERDSPLTERVSLIYSFRGSKCGWRGVFCDSRELEELRKPWFPNAGHWSCECARLDTRRADTLLSPPPSFGLRVG